MEDRHESDLVRIVDASIKCIVRVEDVTLMDARIFNVIFQNEFNDNWLDDGVQIRTACRVDQVTGSSKDSHHGIARYAEVAAG